MQFEEGIPFFRSSDACVATTETTQIKGGQRGNKKAAASCIAAAGYSNSLEIDLVVEDDFQQGSKVIRAR